LKRWRRFGQHADVGSHNANAAEDASALQPAADTCGANSFDLVRIKYQFKKPNSFRTSEGDLTHGGVCISVQTNWIGLRETVGDMR
jgi:hypothetical protein